MRVCPTRVVNTELRRLSKDFCNKSLRPDQSCRPPPSASKCSGLTSPLKIDVTEINHSSCCDTLTPTPGWSPVHFSTYLLIESKLKSLVRAHDSIILSTRAICSPRLFAEENSFSKSRSWLLASLPRLAASRKSLTRPDPIISGSAATSFGMVTLSEYCLWKVSCPRSTSAIPPTSPIEAVKPSDLV